MVNFFWSFHGVVILLYGAAVVFALIRIAFFVYERHKK